MGQSCGADDVDICTRQRASIPIHESIVQRSAQKAKVVENCQCTVAPTQERLKLFFAQLFLLISSVFTEQSQTGVKNVTLAVIEQGGLVVEGQSNPLFVPSVMKTEILLTDDPAQQEEDLLQRYKERIEKLSQQDRVSGQGDGVPKACSQQAAADSRGSRTCVCADTFSCWSGTRREGRMN